MTTIYFAHAMTDYDTEREVAALAILHWHFPFTFILNPNDLEHAAAARAFKRAGHNSMDYFCALARESDYLAFLPTHDNKIGPGVMKEIVEAGCFGKPAYEILLSNYAIRPFQLDRLITIEEIHNRLKTAAA